jgi:high-affinity nickel permease
MALELADSKISGLISAAFLCLVGALVIFILIEMAIIVKVNRRQRQGSPAK